MRRRLPAWAMGLAMAPLGFYFGFISTALPILLAGRGVRVGRIAEVSAVAFSPTFWAFLLCPVLDVGLTKRTYAVIFAVVAAVCLGISTLLLGNVGALTVVATVGCTAAVFFGNALGGWLPDVIEERHYSAVGGTSNVANLGAAGLFAWLVVEVTRWLPEGGGAGLLLGLVMLAPLVLLLFIPLSTQTLRSAGSVFDGFFGDLWRVIRTRRSVIGLVCFLSPTACFALTNLFSGMGKDFRTSEDFVTRLNGPVVAAVCSVGCVAGIWLCQRYLRRTVYVVAGFGGAAAALAMIWMPHTAWFYAGGVLAYNLFQGVNYTAFSALELEIVGPGNPLAATQIALLTASSNLPISYMTAIDGHFYTKHGLPGMFGVDAASAVVVGILLLVWFASMKTTGTGTPASAGV